MSGLGEFLMTIRTMTREQRDEVLARQKQEPGRLFGKIAIELSYIRD